MRVYRLLSEEELNLIRNNKRHSLGKYFEGTNVSNTFKYKAGERYMHFFFKREDCEHIRQIHKAHSLESEQNFIAEFNIPLKRIIGHIGKGFYETSGYDCDYDVCYEIAIPVSIFSPSWLKGYEKVSLSEKIAKEQKQLE